MKVKVKEGELGHAIRLDIFYSIELICFQNFSYLEKYACAK